MASSVPVASLAPGRVAPRGRSRNPGRPARPIPRGNARCAAVPTAEAVDLAISLAADASNVDTFAASSMADALSDTGIPEWQIYYGFIAGLSPFVIAAYEFGKRILIQRQCELCGGSGLIQKGRYSRKCTSCGGFLPWQSWELFFTSEAGNGSRVNAPKGQTSVFYDVDAAKKDSVEQAERVRMREAAAGAAKAAVKPSTLASIDFDDDMFVGADTGAPEPVMQTCDEDDQAAMENVLFGFGAAEAEEDADEEEDEEASEPADAPTRPSTLASMDLDDGSWMNADLSVGKPPAPEPVMQTCDEDDQEAMESALSAISGVAKKEEEEEEVRRPSTLASMDFDDAMFVGADTAGPDPVMQTCDEDDQAAMESVLFRFNARNEIESVEEKRAPSTLASMDFDDDMFADAAGEDIPEPVMQTCDEDDQAAMESVLSTFGSKKDNSDDDDDNGSLGGGRRDLLAGCVALFSGLALNAPAADAAAIVDTGGYMSFEELEARARAAYRGKRLDEAKDLLTRIIGMEPEDGTWRERRAQVLVDLKQFEAAIEDFNAAENLYDSDYKSLGLLSNRALAHEGLSDWNGALKDYTECITLSREIGGVPPYVLNSRGNALSSLGRYDEALVDYDEAAKTFQVMHNLSGAIYARSNAALTLAELGREDDAIREMEAVARRAAGSIDMRAALAAMHWSRGEQDAAERDWNWACEKINSGVLTEGGPALDGCALYRDSDWLGRIRRWPPSMVTKMDDFIRLRKPTSA
jgi:tetratricopeptide (TPR) repeat protein